MFLNIDPPGNPSHTFTNQSGMDLIDLGTLTDFTVYDRVPAALKPQHAGDPNPGTEEGIKVQGGSGGATLVIDARQFDNDTLIEVRENSYVRVSDRSTTTLVQSLSHFGGGVSHLEILTNDKVAGGFRLPLNDLTNTDHNLWSAAEGTNVLVESLPAGIGVKVDTGPGTFDKIVMGSNNTITEQATVLSGAGNDEVILQQVNGDDHSDVIVDFVYANQLGRGNKLFVFSAGTARLDNAPGTDPHPVYVDTVEVSGNNSSERGTVILDHQAVIDDVTVSRWGIFTMATDDALVNDVFVDFDGDFLAEADTTIGDFTLRGNAFFTGSSATSTIGTLNLRESGMLDLGGAAVLTITTLTSDNNPTINALNTSTLTVTNANVIGGTLHINLADEGAADVHVTGTFTVSGTVEVNDGDLLTVGTFNAPSGNVFVTENASVIVENASDISFLNVDGANATVLFQATGSHVENLRIANGGLVTLEERPGPPFSVLIVNFMDLGDPSSPGGKLDLKNNGLIVDYEGSSPHGDIRSLIITAYAGGAWTGNGITSSKAATEGNTGVGYAENDPMANGLDLSLFLGQNVDDTSVLPRYTFCGDANLDGLVNLADFNRLAANFGSTNAVWIQGDFNYDMLVNLTDFNLLAANFGSSLDPEGDGGEGPQMAQHYYTYDELWEMLMNWPRP